MFYCYGGVEGACWSQTKKADIECSLFVVIIETYSYFILLRIQDLIREQNVLCEIDQMFFHLSISFISDSFVLLSVVISCCEDIYLCPVYPGFNIHTCTQGTITRKCLFSTLFG